MTTFMDQMTLDLRLAEGMIQAQAKTGLKGENSFPYF
jgi:hypothetical protein